MLNPFPELLVFGFFIPFILRVTIGLIFLWFAYRHLFKKREAIIASFESEPPGLTSLTPYLRKLAPLVTWIFGIVEILVGGAFIVGFLTQIAALVSIVILLKTLYFRKKYTEFTPYSSLLYIVLIVVSFSLLLSGAGALALDIPL